MLYWFHSGEYSSWKVNLYKNKMKFKTKRSLIEQEQLSRVRLSYRLSSWLHTNKRVYQCIRLKREHTHVRVMLWKK